MTAIDLDREYHKFVIHERYSFLATMIAVIFGGILFYYLENKLIGVELACLGITIALSYRNWRYFSVLSEDQLKSVAAILSASPWILIVLFFSLVSTMSFLTVLMPKQANHHIITGTCISIVSVIIVFINLWFPRYRREQVFYRLYQGRNRRNKYQTLLEQYYSVSKITPPDWDSLKREANSTQVGHDSKMSFEMKLKLLDLQLAESQNVLAFNAFVQTDTKSADLVSNAILILSPFISFLIGISQGLIANYLGPFLGI